MTNDPRQHFAAGRRFAEAGQWSEAAQCFATVARLAPDVPMAHDALSAVLVRLGRTEEAAEASRRAIALCPDDARLIANLGLVFAQAGRAAEAVPCLEQAFALDPNLPGVRFSLGCALAETGDTDRALAVLEATDAGTHQVRGLLLQHVGRIDEALEHLGAADTLRPDDLVTETNLALTTQYVAGVTAEDLFRHHARYARRIGGVAPAALPDYANDPNPDRLPVVGLVSGDLRRHAVGVLTVRAIEGMAKAGLRLVVFANQSESDDITQRIGAVAASWHDIRSLDDASVLALIRREAIDVLVDLSGHTARNRLPLFQLRPAPVQVTWAGHVGTTGLAVFDGLIADSSEVPPGEDIHYSEPVVRLPECYVSFDPPEDAPAVSPLPARANDTVTFASFNRPAKLNAALLATWGQILAGVPRSRLLLNYGLFRSQVARETVTARLAAAGVAPDRVAFAPGGTPAEMLARYREVDIGLDPFPYAGGVTTLEALWMGVPVVSLRGQTFAGRHGATHLHAVGLDELIADDTHAYVATAIALAQDLDRLAKLRASLRERVLSSPLTDGARIGEHLRDAFVALWQAWCERAGCPIPRSG